MRFPLRDQEQLLHIQDLDVELAQVRRQLKHLPIDDEVKATRTELDLTHRRVVEVRTRAQDLDRLVAKSEEELSRVRARADRDRQLADSGVPSKVQEDLEHEITSLTRRLSDLEDAELEMLEDQERTVALATELESEEVRLRESLTPLMAKSQRNREDLDRRAGEIAADRAEAAATVPPQLLQLYERARSGGGAGAAVIKGGQCQGCRLQLPASDVDRIRGLPPEEIEFCDECGCILVRPSES